MSVLRSRHLQIKVDEENAKLAAERRGLIGSGDRSERFVPITTRKIALPTTALATVVAASQAMNGDIDDLVEKLAAYRRELKAQTPKRNSIYRVVITQNLFAQFLQGLPKRRAFPLWVIYYTW